MACSCTKGQDIPLIIRAPTAAPVRRVRGLVSAVDITPTILELVGLRTGAHLAGRSLVDAMNGGRIRDRIAYAETMYPRLHFGWSELSMCFVTGITSWSRLPDPSSTISKTIRPHQSRPPAT